MILSRGNAAILGVLILAAALRFWRIDLPFIEPYNSLSRQAICAAVARNFYKNGFDFFYPEIDENGAGPYLYNAEMPFYTYLMALGYALAGGVKEGVARAVSVMFSLGAIAMLMDLVRRVRGRPAALAAGLFLSASPLYLAVSRSIQPESCMFLATAGVFWAGHLYSTEGKRRHLAAIAAFLFLAVATKIYNLYLVLPLMYLAWRREGWGFLRMGRYWLALGAGLAPLIWYLAMWKAGQSQALIYDPYDFTKTRGPAGKAYWELFAPEYLGQNLRVILVHLLTPLGALLAAVGLVKKGGTSERIFDAWMLSVFFLMLVMWRTVLDHSYYLLPFALPLAFYLGRGAQSVWEWVRARDLVAIAAVSAALLLAGQSAAYAKLYRGIYFVPAETLSILDAGREVKGRTPEDSLVIASYGSSTALLYYCDRKGWSFYPGQGDAPAIEELEKRKRQGARYFVTSRLDWAGPGLEAYLRRHRVLYEKERILLVELS